MERTVLTLNLNGKVEQAFHQPNKVVFKLSNCVYTRSSSATGRLELIF